MAILDLSNAISRKRCKKAATFVLITNSKSHMGFRLVPKQMTLNDLERRNGHCQVTRAEMTQDKTWLSITMNILVRPVSSCNSADKFTEIFLRVHLKRPDVDSVK